MAKCTCPSEQGKRITHINCKKHKEEAAELLRQGIRGAEVELCSCVIEDGKRIPTPLCRIRAHRR